MTAVAAFELTSTATQAAAPFMIGAAFVRGDVPAGQYAEIDLPNFVVHPLNYWNDGSLKLAAIIGRAPLVAGVAKRVNIVKRSSAQAAGTLLTAASIAAAAPTASIQFGSYGTVSLSSLLATPQLTYISTKEMVSCVYAAKCGSDPSLFAQFVVNLFVDGRMEVWACGGNGYLNGSEAVQKNYVPTVIINGVTVWNNGGATYRHSFGAGWDQVAWIGGDPAIIPRHDTGYLNRTKFVPNYWKTGTSSSAITTYSAYQTYSPGANLLFSEAMGGTGFQEDIGLLPNWEAMYCTSQANSTMYKVVLAHARAIRSYGIGMYDTNTVKPVKISSFPTWSVQGPSQGGSPGLNTIKQDNATALTWEKAHHTSAGFLAYVLTAQYRHLETCALNALTVYLCGDINSGTGTDRTPEGQMRTRGWSIRSIGQAGAVIPSSLATLFGDISTWYGSIMAQRVTKYVTPSYAGKFFGMEDPNGNRNADGYAPNGQPCVNFAPWENNFLCMSVSHTSDLDPCDAAGVAQAILYRAHVEQFPVNITGGTGATEFNFGFASSYVLNARSSAVEIAVNTPVPFTHIVPASMGQVFSDSFGYLPDGVTVVGLDDGPANGFPAATTFNPPNQTSTTLGGHSPGSPTGYYANLLPALALAVDHGATGAAASWARFVNAANFSQQDVTANYADTPVWGVVPRSHSQPSLLFTPVDSGAPVATAGPSIIMDSVSFLSTGIVMDTNRGLGQLGPSIPTGFAQPHPLENDIDVSDPVGTEYAYEVTTIPATLTSFLINQDGSQVASGSDGLHVGVQTTKKNGVWITGVPLTIQIGAVTSTVTGVTIAPTTATGSTTFSGSVQGIGSPSQSLTFTKISGPGSLSGSAYTAPAATGSTQTAVVRATSVQDSSYWAEATITIAAVGSTITGISISPTTATGAIAFTKTVTGTGAFSSAATFSKISGGGSIDPSTGAFTPPAQTGSIQTILVRVTSTQDPSWYAEATITIAAASTPTVTSMTITPGAVTVASGASQTFAVTANGTNNPPQGANLTCTLGSFVGNVWTAPVTSVDLTATITATSTFNGVAGSATVFISAAVDSQAPTFTGTLGESHTYNLITVNWLTTTSSDNVAVARREYRINGGAYTAASNSNELTKSHAFAGLTPDTDYSIDVRCVDTSGNVSAPLSITVTTDAAPVFARAPSGDGYHVKHTVTPDRRPASQGRER